MKSNNLTQCSWRNNFHQSEVNWIKFVLLSSAQQNIFYLWFNCMKDCSSKSGAVATISWVNSEKGRNSVATVLQRTSRAEECFWKLKLLFRLQWLMSRHKQPAAARALVYHRYAFRYLSGGTTSSDTLFCILSLSGNKRKWLRFFVINLSSLHRARREIKVLHSLVAMHFAFWCSRVWKWQILKLIKKIFPSFHATQLSVLPLCVSPCGEYCQTSGKDSRRKDRNWI